MNNIPIFTQTPLCETKQLSVGNSNLDGTTGTYVTLVQGSTRGSRISYIRIKALQTTTAGMIRFFVNATTSTNLVAEVPVTVVVPSATAESFEATLDFEYVDSNGQLSQFILAHNDTLIASTQNSETFAVTVFGGDY